MICSEIVFCREIMMGWGQGKSTGKRFIILAFVLNLLKATLYFAFASEIFIV